MFSRKSSLKYRLHSISRQLAIVLAIGMSHIQCSWTPDVETLLYQSEEGTIALQTTKNFKVAPKHPAWISDSLIQEMLGGLTQTQESGLLQDIFSGSPPQLPVFSPSQIRFLGPQLASALSKATPEELVSFICTDTNENSSVVKGTVAVFHPTTLLINLKNYRKSMFDQGKVKNSRGNLQRYTTIHFSQEEALINPKESQPLMEIPANSHWVMINYSLLKTSNLKEPSVLTSTSGEMTNDGVKEPNTQATNSLNELNEQLLDLRRKVDEQNEEIKRLQQTEP
jgi:hypothetical protein